MTDLYEEDFSGWANLQSALLREGRVAEADLDRIAGYRYALLRIERETGMPPDCFPATCPYARDDVVSGAFLPGAP